MNSYIQAKKKKDYFVGNIFEKACMLSLKECGYEIEQSNEQQDINRHTDFFYFNDSGRLVSVDVKGYKKALLDGLIVIELRNVQNNMGWCNNQEEPQEIAFFTGLNFRLFNNTQLFNYVNKRYRNAIKNDITTSDKKKAIKHGWLLKRRERNDRVVYVPLDDLISNCPNVIIPLSENAQVLVAGAHIHALMRNNKIIDLEDFKSEDFTCEDDEDVFI